MPRKSSKNAPLLALDFDAVLAEYTGWKGFKFTGKPRKGVRAFLQHLESSGVPFVVLTTRGDTKTVHEWFVKHKLPMPQRITNEKIPAQAYVDDRAVRFNGDYDELISQLKEFAVYWKTHRKPFKDL